MDSLSYQKLNMTAPCTVTYDKTGLISDFTKAASGTKNDDFQKMMDKAATNSINRDAKVEDSQTTETAVGKTEDAPVQKEDSLTRVKKMLEENGNAVAFKPNWPWICIDMNSGETIAAYNPGEFVKVITDEVSENIPITDLEPWQEVQLNQLLVDPNPIDVSDPRMDAILKATAPGADNSPVAMLEKLVDDKLGEVTRTTVEEMRPQEEDDRQVEITEVVQAPQHIFHNVEAAPVKVGEVYFEEPVDEADVIKQIDTQLIEILQKGESLVRIQLDPEHLGIVTVEIHRSADGSLRISLSAHNAATRNLLERHTGDLQGLISGRTHQSVEVEVQRHQESQQNQNQQNYDGRNGHAQSGQEQRRQQQREHTSPEDFMQQLRLGLIPTDGES